KMKKVELCNALEIKTPKKKDPNAPTKPRSAYIFFSQANRKNVIASYTEKTGKDKMPFAMIAKELGAQWKDATPKVRAKFQKMAEEDKKRYEAEMKEYQPEKAGEK